jgi:hypothetical protein
LLPSPLPPFTHSLLQLFELNEPEADVESEAAQTREQKESNLRRRIKMIKSSIENLTKAAVMCRYQLQVICFYLFKAEILF